MNRLVMSAAIISAIAAGDPTIFHTNVSLQALVSMRRKNARRRRKLQRKGY